NFGARVIVHAVEWGQPFDPRIIAQIAQEHRVQAVLVTHNETSTGILNPVEELGALLASQPDHPLLLVDSISGVPSIPLHVDQPGIDVIIAASQKGFMCPPGLGIIAANAAARHRISESPDHRYYFDLRPYFDDQFPYTPAVSLWYGLQAALELLDEEGEDLRAARHVLLSRMTRAFGAHAGWEPMVSNNAAASPTVTALRVSDPAALKKAAQSQSLQIAGGMGPWHSIAVRIGHVGAVSPSMLFAGLGVLAHFAPQGESGLIAAWNIWHEFLA
ncbi:MAG: aminotransferase class V-fold PLP-dependent enzyme, partial [Firmicutes bacterium]|nr:aminotransferase class V-fold PLP-dependent enzyme [Bacillota bacterium]